MTRLARGKYLWAALWCIWQFGVMLLRLNLRQAGRQLVCLIRCLWWAITGR